MTNPNNKGKKTTRTRIDATILAKQQIEPTTKLRLWGSAVLLGDLSDLEAASKQISNSIMASINKTDSEL